MNTDIDIEKKVAEDYRNQMEANMLKEAELIPDWKQNIINRIKENRQKRFDELKTEYNQRLTDLIHIYFQGYGLDEEENRGAYDILNAEWKSLCIKVRAFKKGIISLKYDAFERAIEENLKAPEFIEAIAKMKAEAEQAEKENGEQAEVHP